MGIFRVSSTNPQFSFIIRKNPASGLVAKKLRKGILFGLYQNQSNIESSEKNIRYYVYFEDGPDECSFSTTTHYLSSSFYMSAIDELLGTARKQRAPEDADGYQHEILLGSVYIREKHLLTSFENHFSKEYPMKVSTKAPKFHEITVSTTKSLHDLLNFVCFFALMVSLSNKESQDISRDENLIQKYVNIIALLDVPYYLRYLFSKRLLGNRKNFRHFSADLEKTSRYGQIKLAFGSTQIQRLDNLVKLLDFKRPIVDVGCNVGNNTIPLAKHLKGYEIHAIDVDPAVLKVLQRHVAEDDVQNITCYGSLDEFVESAVPALREENQQIDVLLTEVIEHMELEQAEGLVRNILDRLDFKTLVVTTPNRSFNVYYGMPTEFRHDDHKWEMTKEDFESWLLKVIGPNSPFTVVFFGIGCEVNGQTVSCGATIRRT